MTERTPEQIAEDKAAVLSLKGAQANMLKALERIATLEQAVASAASFLENYKRYVPEAAVMAQHGGPPGSQPVPIRSVIDQRIAQLKAIA